MSQSELSDLLVIGGGPAGAAAAWHARRLGLRVALLERAPATASESATTRGERSGRGRSGGERATAERARACLGWIGPAGIAEAALLGLKARDVGASEFRGVRLWSWDLQRSVVANDAELCGWVVERDTFDDALRQAARGGGVEIHAGQEVTRVVLGESSVLAHTADGRAFAARLLLVADGAASRCAREIGFQPVNQAPGAARATILAGPNPCGDCGIDIVLGPAQHGALVTIVRNASAQRAAYFRREADAGLPILQAAIAAIAPAGASVAPSTVRSKSAGGRSAAAAVKHAAQRKAAVATALAPTVPISAAAVECSVPAGAALEMDGHVAKRALLIGDAGGFVPAFSNEGIYPAMHSGRLAAAAAARALSAAQVQDELATFDACWRAELADYLRVPNTDLSLLTPLVFSNAQMARRVARAFLLGHKL